MKSTKGEDGVFDGGLLVCELEHQFGPEMRFEQLARHGNCASSEVVEELTF